VDDGATLNLGSNPFLQTQEQAQIATAVILEQIANIAYTPFSCSKINDPAYDLGDLIAFTGGIAGEESICCLQKYVFQYHHRYEMSGYGANPAQANARSKVDKNISGLINNAKGEVMHFYEFRNASAIHIGNNDNKQIIRLKIASNADTRVEIHMNINLVTESVLQSGITSLRVTYFVDSDEMVLHPVETYIDGGHVLHLMYVIPLSANVISYFRVYLKSTGGAIDIDRRGIWLYASGYGIAGDGEWDGTFDIEEEPESITLFDVSFDDDVSESVSITMPSVLAISKSDNVTDISVTPIAIANANDRLRNVIYQDAYIRCTEDGDLRCLEIEDPNAEVDIRTTEEEN
jgi:hypothetical protein